VVVADDLDYGIIIDCGSTGSRIYLYDWPHRDQSDVPLVEPAKINQTVVSLNVNVPLASFAGNPSGAGVSLAPLIAYIKANLDAQEWSITPIYLKATAGMRALDISSQDAIIANVRTYLATTGFLFSDPENDAKVILGTDEGLFGWITVNYALSLLVLTNPTTWGALDLGGASTQITFAPQVPPTNETYLELGGNHFDLYTHSYPLGQDAALSALNAGLVANNINDGNGNIINPCYLRGYNESYNSVTIVGTGDQANCSYYLSQYVIPKNINCNQCGVGSVYQPPLYGQFYAFSGFAYTFQFFDLPEQPTLTELISAGQIFCGLLWDTAQTTYPDESASFLKNYCYTATYINTLLSAYGFSADTSQITVATSIGNFQLSYALGAMIYEASLLPSGPIGTTSTTTTTGGEIGSSGSYVYPSSIFILCLLMVL